jgi:hypothetical protein
VARGRAIGAGDMAIVNDTRLLSNAAKPLAAVADDGSSGRDAGAPPLGFAGLKPARELQSGVQRPAVSLDPSQSAAPRRRSANHRPRLWPVAAQALKAGMFVRPGIGLTLAQAPRSARF